jgi:hypothetical protein
MSEANSKLIDQLLTAYHDLTLLIVDTHDAKKIAKLAEQRARVQEQASAIVEAELDENDAAYRAATKGLDSASDAIRKALVNIGSVNRAIQKIDAVLKTVASLIPK